MRSNRSISLPVSFVVTCCVWLVFLWTMQHAPVSRKTGGSDDFAGSRSSGGLANNFASAVVKFFDDQDPRELNEDATMAEPYFDAEMVEYLPLPKKNRRELAKDLPEVFANLSLTPRNLYRSNVDLDGDRDLDLALLVRLSKTEALGAVLEYVGDEEFRFAGKFYCRYERAQDFSNCFQVLMTGAETMHIFSQTQDLNWKGPSMDGADPDAMREDVAPRPGWRWIRLETGALIRYADVPALECPGSGNRTETAVKDPIVEPVPNTKQDLLRFVGRCRAMRRCRVYRYEAATRRTIVLSKAEPAFCEQ
ncbi:MAG: hypothetical protein U5J83_01910 [Bryobacterales bacterium]|nr:hypothetical protein [Bryobacterales bacterium]